MKRFAQLCLLGALATVCSSARADPALEAQHAYEMGAELFKAGRYPEAIEQFIASHRAVPSANVVLNIAQTLEFLAQRDHQAEIKYYKDAYNWYETYLELSSDADARDRAEKHRSTFASKLAIVDIATTPPRAEIYLERADRGAIGKSPRRLAVDPGDHVILVRLGGYREATAPTQARQGETATVRVNLAPILGTLAVQTQPPGALVKTDPQGTELGRTPLSVELPVGTSRIVITMPRFVEQRREVEIVDGKTSKIALELVREASTVAVLSVSGNVPGANLRFNGAPIGQAPVSVSDLTPGPGKVEIDAPGREPLSIPVLLEAGAAARVDYKLIGTDEKRWPGWRWLGYGTGGAVLAAGGIVGLYSLKAHSDFYSDPSSGGIHTNDSTSLAADVLFGTGAAIVGATLAWTLLSGPPPSSSGHVTVDR